MPQVNFRGRFLWHELLTTDPKAAVKFYGQVAGWTTQAWEQNPSYIMWLTERGPIGGLMPLPDEAKAAGAPPHWLAYIGTPDLAATVNAAVRLGARVLKAATEVPEVGRWAILSDPQGAVFAPFTPATPMPQPDTPQVGTFSWHELATTDGRAAFGFYEQLFGWEKTDTMDMGPSGVYQMFGWGGKSMGGVYTAPKETGAPPHWLGYVFVPDTNKAVDKLKSAGGQLVNGPMEVPGGDLIAVGIDPQGAAFAVHSRNPIASRQGWNLGHARQSRKPLSDSTGGLKRGRLGGDFPPACPASEPEAGPGLPGRAGAGGGAETGGQAFGCCQGGQG